MVELRNVNKSYGEIQALKNINLMITQGELHGLVGPNGAGKTTLIRIINLISVMDEGQVLLNGKAISTKDIANIGYLPEERGLYKKMEVGEQRVMTLT